MSKLFDNLSNLTTTENGAVAFASSTDPIVDLFTAANSFVDIGSDADNLAGLFVFAWKYDKNLAIRAMLQAYDCRNGGGRRDAFMVMMLTLLRLSMDGEGIRDEQLTFIATSIQKYGRWDMYWRLIEFFDLNGVENKAWTYVLMSIIKLGLEDKDLAPLCAKWLPRKGRMANRIRGFLKMKPAEYRHTLSQYSTTETKMSANKWSDIEYEHVPSKCAIKNAAAFTRHDTERYSKYIEDVRAGKASMHTSVLYPYEIVSKLESMGYDVANAAWDSFLKTADYDRSINVLPIVDVSGSMVRSIGTATALDVAMSLGLYLSQTNKGLFENELVTLLAGSMVSAINTISRLHWGMNTDFNKVFQVMLSRAKEAKISNDEMPRVIMVFSDMEFDAAGNLTGYEMIKHQYEEAGYTMPLLVFWNIGEGHPFPALASQPGVIEVSGFSPSIIKPILECDFEKITPTKMVRDILMSDRYDIGLNL